MAVNQTAADVTRYATWFHSQFGAMQPFVSSTPLDFSFIGNLYTWEAYFRPRELRFGGKWARESLQVPLVRLLVETGLAMTSAANPLSDFRAGYAVIRYAEYFRRRSLRIGDSRLVLNNDPGLLSRRLKSLMAEELACGIACYLVREFLSAVHIVDYQVWRNLSNTNVEAHYPDYYAVTDSNHGVLFEVKGRISGKNDKMREARERGAEQVCNGTFGHEPERASGSRFVISSCISLVDSKHDTITHVESIDVNTGHVGISPGPKRTDKEFPKSGPPESVARLAYMKLFRYAGLDSVADHILRQRGFSMDLLPQAEPVSIFQQAFVPIGTDALGNVVAVDRQTLHAIAETAYAVPTAQLKAAQKSAETPQENRAIILNDSVVVLPRPSLLINEKQP